jgi:hypothetical protein
LAIFFRSNAEVYYGYSLIRSLNIPDVRIRIQGASECEIFRLREIYSVIRYLERNADKRLELESDTTKIEIKECISNWIKKFENWDSFYLDFAYTLVLDYLSFAKSDDEPHTYGDIAAYIKASLSEDNPQLYKIYEKYKNECILAGSQLNVILTTIHKVKGLEFDAVVLTPSISSLPFDPINVPDISIPIDKNDIENIEEEKRVQYVAYTRAKKFLAVYEGEREKSIRNIVKYIAKDDNLGVRERKVGLNIGFNARDNYNNFENITYKLQKNTSAKIQRFGKKYNIVVDDLIVGQLSRQSSIVEKMERNNLTSLSGFFVSDIFYWSFQDTLKVDERNGTNYAINWCDAARKKGHIFIVNIAGYGK